MTGEINLSNDGNTIEVNTGGALNDIRIGGQLWIILSKEQTELLREKLEKLKEASIPSALDSVF